MELSPTPGPAFKIDTRTRNTYTVYLDVGFPSLHFLHSKSEKLRSLGFETNTLPVNYEAGAEIELTLPAGVAPLFCLTFFGICWVLMELREAIH